MLFRSQKKEGKTYVGARIAEKIREFGEKTAYIISSHPTAVDENGWLFTGGGSDPSPLPNPGDLRRKGKSVIQRRPPKRNTASRSSLIPIPKPHEDNFRFLIDQAYPDALSLSDLNFPDRRPVFGEYKNIIIEIPGIIYNPYPIDLIHQADAGLMVVRANRSWKKADSLALFTIAKILKEKPIALLNGVEIEVLETVLGELPKRRSRLRRLIRKALTMQVHERQGI